VSSYQISWRSISYSDLIVFQNGSHPPSWNFKDWNFPLDPHLPVITVQRVTMRHCAKFCVDGSNCCSDIAIFQFFFKMVAIRHLGIVMCMFEPPMMNIW